MVTSMETEKNYFGAPSIDNSALKYRIDPSKQVNNIIDYLSGVQKDRRGRVLVDDKGNIITKHPLVNDIGAERIATFLHGTITQTTNLSKYKNDIEINRHMRFIAKDFLKMLCRNRRRWAVTDREAVMRIVEKGIFESMTRGMDGFEAEITGKAFTVHESRNLTPRSSGFSIFGKRHNNDYERYD